MSFASDQAVLNAQWNAATEQAEAARAAAAPHVLMRPRVFPDGNAWCCLLGENLQEGVAGFGETPADACAAFDKEWIGRRLHAGLMAAPQSHDDMAPALLSALKDARDQLIELARNIPDAAWLTDQLAEGEGLLAGINVVIARAEGTR